MYFQLSSLLKKTYSVTTEKKTSSAVLLYGTTSFSIFYKTKFDIFLEFGELKG